jgi:serine/threonine protein kinase
LAIDETITITPSPTTPFAAGPIVVPRELGAIRLHREIGRGGMGAVWLGQDRMLGRQVAVKFLLHTVADETDPHFVRFLEGARLAAAVKHVGLTTLHHADLTCGIPYLVMEYVDGPSLHQLTSQTGALSLPESLAVLQAVCEAVGELHDREVVHRDIKPGNVLLDRDGRIYVTDFGLVCPRVTPAVIGDRPQTIAGTPPYMAPEMFDGAVSLRSDVYALGVMAYGLLAGRSPFVGTLERLVDLHRNAPLPSLILSGGGDSTALEEVLQRATHKEATYRYKTARQFLRALREAARDTGVWSQGTSLLVTRIACYYRDSQSPHSSEPTSPSPTPYFQRLTELAIKKQRGTSKIDAPNTTWAEKSAELSSPTSFDVRCVGCDYNLCGLSRDGRCPECGVPVAESLRPELLQFADPMWLKTVSRGAKLVHWLFPVALLIVVLVFALQLFFNTSVLVRTAIVSFIGFAYLVLWVVGARWLLSNRSPESQKNRLTFSGRIAIVGMALSLFAGTFALITGRQAAPKARTIEIEDIVGTLSPFFLGLWGIGFCQVMLDLTLRIPHRRLVRWWRWGKFFAVILLVLGVYSAAINYYRFDSIVYSSGRRGIIYISEHLFFGIIDQIVGLSIFLYLFYAWFVLLGFRKAFRRNLLRRLAATAPAGSESRSGS